MHDIHVCRPSKTLKAISAVLVVTTVLSTAYAYRQRVWADEIHERLVEVNLDDVKLMHLLTPVEKVDIARRFYKQGEDRIATWVISH